MARYCTECGEALTEPMRRCPRCGADVVVRPAEEDGIIRKLMIFLAVLMVVTTLFAWYSVHLSIDGGGSVDAAANFLTRILPGYSGVSTPYGIATFALALVLILASVARRRVITLITTLLAVALAVVAMIATPDFIALNEVQPADGVTLAETLEGPFGEVMADERNTLRKLSTAIEMASSYVVVDLSYGLYMMLLTSITAFMLALYDLMRGRLGRKTSGVTRRE